MKNRPEIKVFASSDELAVEFSKYFVQEVGKLVNKQEKINICLSGGRTPRYIFSHLASEYRSSVNWKKIHFYWGDERCVDENHVDSNYGMTKSHLLDIIDIPKENIHYIIGSKDPDAEAKRYEKELIKNIEFKNDIPCFDIVMLGLGEDGHTASVFPENLELLNSTLLTAVTEHPLSKKPRITLTPIVFKNAKQLIYLVTGNHKAEIASLIYNNRKGAEKYPAMHIAPSNGKYLWFLDQEAASLLE